MPRETLIDALRGFALFGILAVNIQSFVLGLGAPSLGFLDAGSTPMDHAAVLLTAFLLEFKFYPLFCFCFGYGFALQTRRWTARGDAAGPRFRRRMEGLLFIGVLHGGLLWFGDILTRYALAGFILKRYAGKGPRQLRAALKLWLIVALLMMAIGLIGSFVAGGVRADDAGATLAQQSDLRAEHARVFETYVHGNYASATIQRVKDYALVTSGFVLLIPQVMVIFLLGALAAQLGVLRHPERHRRFWAQLLRASLIIGIPANGVHAWMQWQASMHPWTGSHSSLSLLALELAPILSIACVAALALSGGNTAGRAMVNALAPAGRLSLTLYASQSVIMACLLNGFGLGLGATATPATLLAMALAIFAVQLVIARIMFRAGIAGPLETWWRRYTYAPDRSGRPHRENS